MEVIDCDVLILGAGPCGFTAGIYAARNKVNTIILETAISGGQIAATDIIANYPGTDGDIHGIELAENMKKTALKFGAKLYEFQQIVDFDFTNEIKIVQTVGKTFKTKCIIIATGSTARKLDILEEEQFHGKGIHYCATCDGPFYQDADIVVVGGGISALEEAIFLSRFAKKIYIINKNAIFKAPKMYVDEAMENPIIQILYQSKIKEAFGERFVSGINIVDLNTNAMTRLDISGIFVYIGAEANTGFLKGKLDLSQNGYIKTDEDMMTNIPGIFAAGDVRDKKIRQVSTAVGDGTIAGIMASQFKYAK